MKKISCMAVIQIVMGCVIALYGVIFDVTSLREQERAIGQNLIDYSSIIDDHKKLVDVTANKFFSLSSSLRKTAYGCKKVAEWKVSKLKIKNAPISQTMIQLNNHLVEQADVLDESRNNFPKVTKALDGTRDNLKNMGEMLIISSPVKRMSNHVRCVSFMLAAMMILNGFAFLILSKDNKHSNNQ